MEIKIKNRLVIINGPSCMGKSTLADRIQEEYSGKCAIIGHDDILEYVNKNQSQEKIDDEFHNYYLGTICNALTMPDIELLVLDTFNIEIKRLLNFIVAIRGFTNYKDPITLIKMNVDSKIHDEFIHRKLSALGMPNDAYMKAGIKSQVLQYKGIDGALYKPMPYCDNIIVTDPRNVRITFDLPKKGRNKNLKN